VDFVTTAVANGFTLSGSTSGTTSSPTTFTVTPNGTMATLVVVTPAATNAGSVSPATLSFPAGTSAAKTFTVTRAADGISSVSITNDGGLSNFGSPISYSTLGDPSWTTTVQTIEFLEGTASNHDLTQYTTNFNSATHEMQMADGSNALPTGVTLNSTGSLSYDGSSPIAALVNVQIDIEDRLQTWAQRSTATGVVRTFSFAEASHIGAGTNGYGYGYNYGWYAGFDDALGVNATDHPVIDTTVAPSDTPGGSMRVTMDATRGGGEWVTNFSTDLQTRYNVGDEFFVQWRQRFNAAMLGPNVGLYGSWKQCLISSGDTSYAVWNGATETGVAQSCRCPEICLTSYEFASSTAAYNSRFPMAYTRCPSCSYGSSINLTESHATEFSLWQNMMAAPYCSYNNTDTGSGEGTNLPGGNCFIYYANEWMTFQIGVTCGPTRVGATIPNSRIRIWGQREGQPSVALIDMTVTLTMTDTDPGYGKFWITTRNPYTRNTTMQTWYSQLIISTQRIPDAL
jgi:hypothetical protein